ncbi:hypothetical protein EJV47_06490 [Hymenobacter gummosus]|uniref:Uncharacterized protein n=1 Tax=Hymenobacter gummosus TaxID=1776032 RepID=A0A431U5Y2_9BACT|nr:hypothetical protein [Hymenobacter gummosus]RTQ51447.1 hypothetical protein EJV47_06490 [Hymenobacter gummosus]
MRQKTSFFSTSRPSDTHVFFMHRTRRARYFLCALGVWGGVGGATAQAQKVSLLIEAQQAFGQRLETTLRYQEAVEREGVTTIKRSLQVGKRAYELEHYNATVAGYGRVKELFLLQRQNKDTVSTSIAKFRLSHEVTSQGKTVCSGVFHRYLSPLAIEAGQFFIVKDFNPAAFLTLAPSLIPTGQTLYVLNEDTDVRGDTLACYQLTRAESGQPSLHLYERRTAASRRWYNNNRLTCRWDADLTHKTLLVMQILADGRPGLQWVRRYANQTDFFESHFYFEPGVQDGDGMVKREFYRREFKQRSGQQALDHYTLNLQTEPPSTLSFDITHYHH